MNPLFSLIPIAALSVACVALFLKRYVTTLGSLRWRFYGDETRASDRLIADHARSTSGILGSASHFVLAASKMTFSTSFLTSSMDWSGKKPMRKWNSAKAGTEEGRSPPVIVHRILARLRKR